MTTTRRTFIDRLATGSLALGGLALASSVAPDIAHAAAAIDPAAHQGAWDTSWTDKLTGRVRTVFDVPEIESAYGVWRATIWARQYEAVLGVPAAQLSTALVIRHNAIVLAMTHEFWDKYGVAAHANATHPLTGEPATHNPALLGAAQGVGDPYAQFSLTAYLARGGVALACDLALQDMIALVAAKDGVATDVARTRALAGLVPGVILQPSGVFAVLRAQETKQALYIRAS
jgi:hypothetical protein